MAVTFQRKIILSLILIFSIIPHNQMAEINIKTNMKKWKVHSANEESAKSCEKSFKYLKDSWELTSCKQEGTNGCILETEKYPTKIVQELHIEITVSTHKPRKDLVIGYKATDFNGRVHQVHHESSIQTNGHSNDVTYKHHINVTSYQDISFEFSNFYGYCGEIRKLNVAYNTCNYEEDSLVNPVVHGSPSVQDADIRLNATCKRNARPTLDSLYFMCSSNGTVMQIGSCMCLQGFRLYNNACVKCPKYTFKPYAGNHECKACGLHSYNSALRDKCVCRYGYYREIDRIEDSSASCYSSKPLKLIITGITSDSAHIEWKLINKSINWKRIHFTINCDNCLDNEGNFPFQTYRREIQLNDLEPSKKYVISVTASSEEGIAHTASTTIWGKFVTTHATYGKDIITITVISIIVPLVTITTTIFVYMYCRQKRKSEHLRKKISSLKRQRRPPKPPRHSPKRDEYYDIPDEKHNISDTMSDINPYAVYVPPSSFKMSDKASIRGVIIEMKDDDEDGDDEKRMLPYEQYESMDGATCTGTAARKLCTKDAGGRGNTSIENPYVMPSWGNSSTNHSYVDIKDADPLQQSSINELCKEPCYTNMNEQIMLNTTNDEMDDVHRNMPLIPLRPRQLLNDRSRATSLYKDVFNYATTKELNAAKLNLMEINANKLNCHYMRYDRKKAMDLVAMIKRSHSADDVNELPLIM